MKFFYNSDNKRKIIDVCWWIITGITILPYAITITQSLPSKDDFSMAKEIVNSSTNALWTSIVYTIDHWKTWGGFWPYIFLEYFINPMDYASTTSYAIGIEMMLFFVLFIVILYFLFKNYFIRYIDDNSAQYKWVFLAFIIMFLNTDIYSETLYWWVGNLYMWQAMAACLLVLLAFKYFDKEPRISSTLLLGIYGFVACPGYQMAVFAGICYLYLLVDEWCENKKLSIMRLIPLVMMFLGGCSGCFAPGNFARRDTSSVGEFNIVKSLIYSVKNILRASYDDAINPIVFIMLLLIFVFGITQKKQINCFLKKFAYGVIGVILSTLGVSFPVALGYASDEMPSRVLFILNFCILIWATYIVYTLGTYIGYAFGNKLLNNSSVLYACVFGTIIAIYFMIFPQYDDENLLARTPWLITTKDIGNCIEESVYWRGTLDICESTTEKNVAISMTEEEYDRNSDSVLFPLVIGEDSGYWANIAMSIYYGVDSIELIVEK